MGVAGPLEVAKTVLEFADFTWVAMECKHHLLHHDEETKPSIPSPGKTGPVKPTKVQKLEALRLENRRLRNLLEQNLKLLENISQSASVSQSCPPDLQERIISAVNSKSFLDKLEASSRSGAEFPFSEVSAEDMEKAELLNDVDQKDPSWWVLISDEPAPPSIEAHCEIDAENYVVVTEDHIVDGIAHFMAKCIASNPKARDLSPQELQKAITKGLEGVSKLETVVHLWTAGKMFYTLSTWGLALAGLYQARGFLKLATMGVHSTSKVALRALR